MLTLQQLENHTKLMIFDAELKQLPAKLVEQLGKSLQRRWIILNKGYYASPVAKKAEIEQLRNLFQNVKDI